MMTSRRITRLIPLWLPRLWRVLRAVLLLLLLGLALWGVVELAARATQHRSARFLIPDTSAGAPLWQDNPFFAYRFFPARLSRTPLPIRVAQTPGTNTLRVCLLSEPSTSSLPQPAYGLARQLELILEQYYPGQTIEVLPLTIADSNSHILREIARELERLQPRAVIVMVGNNEFVGPFGPACPLTPTYHDPYLTRLLVLLSRSRAVQTARAALHRLAPARIDLIEHEILEPSTLRNRIDPASPRLHSVYRGYRKNLHAILRAAKRTTPHVILCTIPVNLLDCAPFATAYLDDETFAQRVREALRKADKEAADGNLDDALRLYTAVTHLHPTHAEALYRAGKISAQKNRTAEATSFLSRARDADALRMRADSRINAIIREAAASRHIQLLDAETLFALRSPHGIPGGEFFFDHIHMTFQGHHTLAAALAHRLETMRVVDRAPAARTPDARTLDTLMTYTPWGYAAQLDTIIQQHLRPPFRNQLSNPETLARYNTLHTRLLDRVKTFTPRNTRVILERRQSQRPDDPWLATLTAWHLLQANDPMSAEEYALQAHARWPHRFDSRALLALSRAYQGQAAESGIQLILGDNDDTGYYDIHAAIGIGEQLLNHQQYAPARPWLEYALHRDPHNSQAAILLAQTLYRLEEGDHAITLLRDTLKRNPRNPRLWEELAVLQIILKEWDDANRSFAQIDRLAPNRYERFLKWAQAFFHIREYKRAYTQISRYLAVVPDDPEALFLLHNIEANLPRPSAPEPAAETKPQPILPFL